MRRRAILLLTTILAALIMANVFFGSYVRRGRILLISLAVVAVILPGVAAAQEEESTPGFPSDPSLPDGIPNSGVVPGQIIVKYEEATNLAEEAAVRRQEDLKKEEELDLINAEVVKVEGQSTQAALRDLNSNPKVEYAEPDQLTLPDDYSDEPRFGELWGLNNTGQTITGVTGVPNVDINALEASKVTQGDPSVVVAVIDTGVDFSHPDLAGQAWVNSGESGVDGAGNDMETNGVDDDGNGYVDDVNGWDTFHDDNTVDDPGDFNYHGTHVAGTIAASVNGRGVVGVAPKIKIMALKTYGGGNLNYIESSVSQKIEAIEYAERMGAKISNNSWSTAVGYSQALKDAIGAASGMLFVASAGNNALNNDTNRNRNYPASYNLPNIVSVAAIDNQGNLADFSNYGATSVDISAPGVSILSALPARPEQSAMALSSVGASGKALTTGFRAEQISGASNQASFMTKAFSAVGRDTQEVVLVDDDMSAYDGYSDVRPNLSAAIESATGAAPQVIDVSQGGDGPSLSQLQGKTVVWATGRAAWSDNLDHAFAKSALTITDQTTLTDFLNGGGKLILTGSGVLDNLAAAPFVTHTLNLNVCSSCTFLFFTGDAFSGSAGTAFAGESYSLPCGCEGREFPDVVSPNGSPSVLSQGIYPYPFLPQPAGLRYLDGTSMAAPHVAGVAALVVSVKPGFLSDPVALKNRVMNTGKRTPATVGKTVTGDIVDALAATDFIAPSVTGTVPTDGATDVARTIDLTATFSEKMKKTTITESTFKLYKKDSTTPLKSTVSYDAANKRAVLDPWANLYRGATYKAVVTTEAKDQVGNALDQDPTMTGNQRKVWFFMIRT